MSRDDLSFGRFGGIYSGHESVSVVTMTVYSSFPIIHKVDKVGIFVQLVM